LFSVTQPAAPEPVPEPAAKTDPFADLVRIEIRNTDDIPFDIPRFSVVPDDEPLEPAPNVCAGGGRTSARNSDGPQPTAGGGVGVKHALDCAAQSG